MGGGKWQRSLGLKLVVLAATAIFGFLANFLLKLSWQRYQIWADQKAVRWSRECRNGSCLFTLRMAGGEAIPQMDVRIHSNTNIKITGDSIRYSQDSGLKPKVTMVGSPGAESLVRGFTVANFRENEVLYYHLEYLSQSPQPANPLILTIQSADPRVVAQEAGQHSSAELIIPIALVLLILGLVVSIYFAVRYHHECQLLGGDS